MAKPLVFISYKHGDPWAKLAQRFHLKLVPMAGALGYSVFLDKEEIKGGGVWRKEIQDKLKKTTHFVALLCDEYWQSTECRKEVDFALSRFRKYKTPRLLFVLGEQMKPQHLVFDESEKAGEVVKAVGDVQFLGPFDNQHRLVRLEWNDAARLSDQMAELAESFIATLPKAGR
jgi:hypothetical protein